MRFSSTNKPEAKPTGIFSVSAILGRPRDEQTTRLRNPWFSHRAGTSRSPLGTFLGSALALLLLAGCAAPTPVSSLSNTASSGPYRLRPGDTVLMEVFQEPYMTTRQQIFEDGTIAVGLIGRVPIAGETVAGAADKIAARLDERHLVSPQVVLTIENYAPRRFVVWGQVRNPGTFLIPGGESMTLPAAIAMAGGNTDIGDLRSVTVLRGGTQRRKLNALSPTADRFLVEEGDVIRVSETLF